jgi:hypothetical protein
MSFIELDISIIEAAGFGPGARRRLELRKQRLDSGAEAGQFG